MRPETYRWGLSVSPAKKRLHIIDLIGHTHATSPDLPEDHAQKPEQQTRPAPDLVCQHSVGDREKDACARPHLANYSGIRD